MEKFEQDAAWDGIKGYVTNTSHTAEEVIANYRNLWFIERAFYGKLYISCSGS